MRIAFTHNVQLSNSEEEAEFDTPETVSMIVRALAALGHDVEPLEVSGPASRTVARLEALNPDLVFNTAEGRHGRFREAFFPALFDRLGLPFTGSDAYACALTLDKQLTKLILAQHGVPVPKGVVITRADQLHELDFTFPVMVKPNYEGSSMGITRDSVVEDRASLEARIHDQLAQYSAGLLVEEFVVGRDLVVPFLEKASPETGGVLEPAVYNFDPEYVQDRKYPIYDLELKTVGFAGVEVKVPADIPADVRQNIMACARKCFDVLQMKDAARIDFRVRDDGTFAFLEVNALPSLETGASIYKSSALVGLGTTEAVMDCMVRSASERFGLDYRPQRKARRRPQLRVGLLYNLRAASPNPETIDERTLEHDTPQTIAAIRQALESYGHEVVELEATPELSALLPAAGVDVAFNVAEGMAGRTRESQVPALLELLGIPYTGSDPTAISLTLDKGLAKRIVRQAGIPTANFTLMATGKERLPKEMSFPVIVKPVAEGSSLGVSNASVVEDDASLRALVREQAERFGQPMLVEEFLPGREFTLGMLGERRPRVLPPLEVVFTNASTKHPVYSLDSKFHSKDVELRTAPDLDAALARELQRVARGAFLTLGCRDVARVDVRLDAKGVAHFIECNPLPGLAPGFSDLCIIAERANLDYRGLIGEILAPALRRLREKRRQRLLSMPDPGMQR